MALNESNVVARARRLLVCTIDAANFSDKMDIIFVAEMIEKIGKFVEKFKDVSYCSGCADLFTKVLFYKLLQSNVIHALGVFPFQGQIDECSTSVCCHVV